VPIKLSFKTSFQLFRVNSFDQFILGYPVTRPSHTDSAQEKQSESWSDAAEYTAQTAKAKS
jgi:hypothetical protein